ncbi:MAG: SEC-C metal-binding domain-containing protein [Rhodoplanes sp.]
MERGTCPAELPSVRIGSAAPELSIRDSLTYRRSEPKVGRNEPCPCGSGKKYKLCCGRVTFH